MYSINIIINKIAKISDKIFILQSDLSKAFDKCNRKLIIIKCHEIGINGKNIRLIINELKNQKVYITFNDKYSKTIKISNGLPQGHNEAGPIWNIYINGTLEDILK